MVFETGDPLRWIHSLLFGRPMNFSFVDEYLAASACPFSRRDIQWLKMKGIGAILTVREVSLSSEWTEGIDYLHVNVKNHFAPSPEELSRSVDFIVTETEKNRKVVVHCAGGKGRTGTVLASYLCYKYGLTPEQAISEVRRKRRGSIEKGVQENAVLDYYQLLLKKKDRKKDIQRI